MNAEAVTSVESDVITSVKEAAAFIRMSRSWTYRASARGELPSFKAGSRRRWRKSSLRRWMDERERKAAS